MTDPTHRSRMRVAAMTGAAMLALGLVCGLAAPAQADVEDEPGALANVLDALDDVPAAADPAQVDDVVDEISPSSGFPADGPGSLQVSEGAVAVSIRYDRTLTDADLAAVSERGRILASSAEWGLVEALVAPPQLAAVAALPGVDRVTPSLEADHGSGGLLSTEASVLAGPASSSTGGACRALPSDAATALNAELSALGRVDGTGVTVGIISDSFDRASNAASTPADDIAAGLLPGPGNPCGYEQPVQVLTEPPAGEDEGRAMAQVVHSIAPGARLLFATGYGSGTDGELQFAQTIQSLADAGADVIVDDIVLFEEPAFEQGVIGRTIEQLAAQGVVYLTSAGNYSVTGQPGTASEGYDIAGWRTSAYRPTPCPQAIVDAFPVKGPEHPLDCMDFGPGTAGPDPTDSLTISTEKGSSGVLYWAEPTGGAKGTFLPALIAPDGTVNLGSAMGSGVPLSGVEVPALSDGVYDLVIVRDGDVPITPAITVRWLLKDDLKDAEYYADTPTDVVGSTIGGHQADESSIAVAAAPVSSPTVAEPYSSAGPAVHLFQSHPVGDATPLAEPVVFPGPDIMGVDRMRTNFFWWKHPVVDQPGVWEFWGTSAAAPSMAGVAALAKQVAPGVTTAELKAAMASTARPSTSPFANIDPVRMIGPGVADTAALLAALRAPVPTPPVPVPAPAAVTGQGGGQLAATGATSGSPSGLALAVAALLLVGGLGALRRSARRSSRRI